MTGAGPTPETAQNGIQVSNGALASISSSTISGNECEDANVCGFSGTQAAGVLFFGAAPGSKITGSTVKENDFGVYYFSEAPTQPTSSEVAISTDVLSADRDEGVILDQGDASVKGDTINGPGHIGIDLLQYEGQAYGVKSTASGDTIENMSVASVDVESDLQSGDFPGRFVITNSTITTNDAQSIVDASPSFTVLT